MRKVFIGIVVALAVAAARPAQAQTHPCDINNGTSFTVLRTSFPKVTFCEPVNDTSGNPLPVTGAILYISGTQFVINNVTQITSTPNSIGLVQYQATMSTTLARGNYTMLVTAFNMNGTTRQESGQSGPFALSVVDPPPSVPPAPTHVKVSD